jgi:hypothetical protein
MKLRLLHRRIAPWIFILLAASATTGMAYWIGEEFLGISKPTAELLMHIHQGSWLGKEFRVYYVLATGLGLLAAGLLGLGLLRPKKSA